VKDLLNCLWEQYNKLCGGPLSYSDASVESSTVTSIDVSGDNDEDTLIETKYWIQFTQHIEELSNLECMTELDRYFFGWVWSNNKRF
jgi:hypothetical protein